MIGRLDENTAMLNELRAINAALGEERDTLRLELKSANAGIARAIEKREQLADLAESLLSDIQARPPQYQNPTLCARANAILEMRGRFDYED